MNLALNEHLMSARCVKAAVTHDPYVLLKYSSLFCLGTATSCDVIWLDASNIQWGEGIIHLQQMAWNTKCNSTACSAAHALLIWTGNFHRRLWKAYRYLSSLCSAIGLENTSGPKSQKLLNSGLPPTCAADPNPAKDFSYDQMAPASKAQNQAQPGQAGAKSRRKRLCFFLNPSQQILLKPHSKQICRIRQCYFYMLPFLPTEHASLVSGGEDHGGTKGGKNHSNYLKELWVQEILEDVHYVSVNYTEIHHLQPIKRQRMPKHWAQHLGPWVQGNQAAAPGIRGHGSLSLGQPRAFAQH